MIDRAGRSLLLGLIGAGIQASRTPALHEQEGQARGLRTIYRLIDLERLELSAASLPDLLLAAERMGFDGLNITHPCKQAVLPLLHELSPDADAIGAVNTVLFRDGKRIGHNTDCWGFTENFRRGLPGVAVDHVVQLGAGGAGAAVARGAIQSGVRRLSIFDVESAKAQALAERLNTQFAEMPATVCVDLASAMSSADGLINTTPIGMVSHPGLPLPAALLRPTLWVAEIVYFPLETALLRTAREIGCPTLDGGGMAVFQAVEAFRLFSGVTPDAERVRRHFDRMEAAIAEI
ncbi:MAG TPA: shikimate dehydrogenase [Acetobacteraceae bacterium]|nr:shikimate dehydrogenase [Acetobacteraceae bacterium]